MKIRYIRTVDGADLYIGIDDSKEVFDWQTVDVAAYQYKEDAPGVFKKIEGNPIQIQICNISYTRVVKEIEIKTSPIRN